MKSRTAGAFLSPSIGKTSGRIAAYAPGRICATPGCDTVLSTYNPAVFCSLHDATGDLRARP